MCACEWTQLRITLFICVTKTEQSFCWRAASARTANLISCSCIFLFISSFVFFFVVSLLWMSASSSKTHERLQTLCKRKLLLCSRKKKVFVIIFILYSGPKFAFAFIFPALHATDVKDKVDVPLGFLPWSLALCRSHVIAILVRNADKLWKTFPFYSKQWHSWKQSTIRNTINQCGFHWDHDKRGKKLVKPACWIMGCLLLLRATVLILNLYK